MPGISPIAISPMFGKRGSKGIPIPPPPYAIFSADGSMELINQTAPSYQFGTGPGAASTSFSLLGLGLVPAAGNITITPDANFTTYFEIFNPNTSAYTGSIFTIPYTGSAITLAGFNIRLKSGLTTSGYAGKITITAPNTIPFVFNASGAVTASPYDTDAVIFFGFLSTQPSSGQKTIYNNLFLSLKASGDWANLDRLWVLASENKQNALISLKNPGSTAITEVNAPAWTQYQGYNGDGVTNYLDTNFIMNSSSIYLANDACAGVYSRIDSSGDSKIDLGVIDNSASNTGTSLVSRGTAGAMNSTINYNGNSVNDNSVPDSKGMFSIVRTDSSSSFKYRNGVSISPNSAQVSTGRAITSCLLLASRYVNSVVGFSPRQLSAAFFGNSSVNQLSLYNTIQAYMTALGTQV